jgi:hypothetical protein
MTVDAGVQFVTVVAGLARCGSSATMQALVAGGMDPGIVAEFPYMEDGRQSGDGDKMWLWDYVGGVIKWLDPHQFPLPADCPPLRTIWLDRDPKQQARSGLKWSRANRDVMQQRHIGINVDEALAKMAGSYVPMRMRELKHERPACLTILRRRGEVLLVRFEDLVHQARMRHVMTRICDFLEPHVLDVDRMCKVILPRSSKCSPVMLEEILAKKGPMPSQR